MTPLTGDLGVADLALLERFADSHANTTRPDSRPMGVRGFMRVGEFERNSRLRSRELEVVSHLQQRFGLWQIGPLAPVQDVDPGDVVEAGGHEPALDRVLNLLDRGRPAPEPAAQLAGHLCRQVGGEPGLVPADLPCRPSNRVLDAGHIEGHEMPVAAADLCGPA
jgi:hypothetical protein